jgi:hypothetical protein
MNVEIGAEATLFPEKEYINGIAVAVQVRSPAETCLSLVALLEYRTLVKFLYSGDPDVMSFFPA